MLQQYQILSRSYSQTLENEVRQLNRYHSISVLSLPKDSSAPLLCLLTAKVTQKTAAVKPSSMPMHFHTGSRFSMPNPVSPLILLRHSSYQYTGRHLANFKTLSPIMLVGTKAPPRKDRPSASIFAAAFWVLESFTKSDASQQLYGKRNSCPNRC